MQRASRLPNASDGALICVCVYRKGAQEVVRRLTLKEPAR